MLENRGMTAYGLHVKSLVTDEKGVPILNKKDKKMYRLHQSVISKIKNNKSKALQLDILDVLCELLECQPADLMIYESTTQSASTTQDVERATQSTKHTQSASTTQSDNTTQSGFYTDIYFVNNTGKTISQLLDEEKKSNTKENKPITNPFNNSLMTRVWDVGYDKQNKKRLRKRLVNLEGAGWLKDEDLAELDPDELVRDFDKSENVRLGDLRVHKSARQKVERATQSAKHTQSASTTQSDNTTQSASDNEKLLTTADIAERLGLSMKSITDYINKGILPTIQPKGARTPHFVKESDYPAFELYYRNLTGKQKP